MRQCTSHSGREKKGPHPHGYAIARSQHVQRPHPIFQIFTGVTVLMYVVALMHVCEFYQMVLSTRNVWLNIGVGVSLYRLFRGYVWVNTSYDIFMYWITITWEGIFHTVLHGVMVWLAQFLLVGSWHFCVLYLAHPVARCPAIPPLHNMGQECMGSSSISADAFGEHW